MKRTTLILLSLSLACCGCGGKTEEISPQDVETIRKSPDVSVAAGDWPWWRGPTRDNHAAGPAPPTSWSENENVIWRVAVPGRGHASPIVVGQHVVVATADESDQSQSLICYGRSDGKRRWERTLHNGGFEKMHAKNSQASATPACDGQSVFAVFLNDDAIWVSAVRVDDGKLDWSTRAGEFATKHGYGSSPVLYKSLVIVAGDSSSKSFLTALDRQSGDIVWRISRKNDDSFGTPIVGQVAGKTQLLLSGQDTVIAYDPASGQQLWSAEGSAESTGNTMAWYENLAIASGGYPENNVMAFRADDGGTLAWEKDFKMYVPSPLVVGDRVYCMSDGGILYCLNAGSGETLWRKRMGGDFSASPVVASGFIFIPSERGTMHVFKDGGDTYEEVAKNFLDDGGFASPVICGGQLFLRTNTYLYCIGYPGT